MVYSDTYGRHWPAGAYNLIMNSIRVALVDDHHVVRRGVRAFLESFADIAVVGEAASAEEAFEKLEAWQADVVLMDLLLPGGMDGISATQRLHALGEKPRVVALTAYMDDARVTAALRAGAIGYVRKDALPEVLLEAVRAAGRGQLFLDPSAAEAASNGSGAGNELTPREREVLLLMARRMSNHQIADALTVGDETVKSHVTAVLGKLGLNQRGQVALWALKHGWVGLEELVE